MVEKNLIMGVDPGFMGALALYNYETRKLIDVFDMPIKGVGKKREIDIFKLSGKIDSYSHKIRLSVIEEVGVMTGREGRQGMFRFGVGVGIIKGILGAHLIPTYSVVPGVWKSIENLSRDKEDSLKKARILFPEMEHQFRRKKDDGRAEAAILSKFGVRFMNVV